MLGVSAKLAHTGLFLPKDKPAKDLMATHRQLESEKLKHRYSPLHLPILTPISDLLKAGENSSKTSPSIRLEMRGKAFIVYRGWNVDDPILGPWYMQQRYENKQDLWTNESLGSSFIHNVDGCLCLYETHSITRVTSSEGCN